MTLASAVGNLFQSIADIVAAILHSILAIIQTIFAAVYGIVSTAFATAQGILGFLWSNIGLLLVVGFALLIYQIFVVDKGRGPVLSQKVGGGRKKAA